MAQRQTGPGGVSSYWKEALKGFSYSPNGNLSWYSGFGVNSRSGILKQALHKFFQTPFYLQGRKYRDFAAVLRTAKEVTARQNRIVNYDVFRHILTVCLCLETIDGFREARQHCVIGDGLTNLTSLLLMNTQARVVNINLAPVIMAEYSLLEKVIPAEQIALLNSSDDLSDDDELPDDIRVIYIPADNHEAVRKLQIYTFFNIASMQEMDPEIIKGYFDDIKNGRNKNPCFYCCNRVEKQLSDGTLVRFDSYPWAGARELLDEACPWCQQYYNVKNRPFILLTRPYATGWCSFSRSEVWFGAINHV